MPKSINNGAITLKKVLMDKHISVKQLAEMLQKSDYNITAGVLSNKLYRNTFTLNEYTLIANVLGCDIKVVSSKDNIEYIVQCDVEKEKHKFEKSSTKMKKVAQAKQKKRK